MRDFANAVCGFDSSKKDCLGKYIIRIGGAQIQKLWPHTMALAEQLQIMVIITHHDTATQDILGREISLAILICIVHTRWLALTVCMQTLAMFAGGETSVKNATRLIQEDYETLSAHCWGDTIITRTLLLCISVKMGWVGLITHMQNLFNPSLSHWWLRSLSFNACWFATCASSSSSLVCHMQVSIIADICCFQLY